MGQIGKYIVSDVLKPPIVILELVKYIEKKRKMYKIFMISMNKILIFIQNVSANSYYKFF